VAYWQDSFGVLHAFWMRLVRERLLDLWWDIFFIQQRAQRGTKKQMPENFKPQ